MEIKVEEYVRVKEWNVIGKILKITARKIYIDSLGFGLNREQIYKNSKNIIDLIEVGDYVNGYKVISVDYDVIDDKTECIELDLNNNYQYNFISANQTKTIVTKEQMASIEYKVEGDR